jgi:hypothetical protein
MSAAQAVLKVVAVVVAVLGLLPMALTLAQVVLAVLDTWLFTHGDAND